MVYLVGFTIGGLNSRAYLTATSKPNTYTAENKETYENISHKTFSMMHSAIRVAKWFDETKEYDQRTIALKIWAKTGFSAREKAWYQQEVAKEVLSGFYEFQHNDRRYLKHAIEMIERGNLTYKQVFGDKTQEDIFKLVQDHYNQQSQSWQGGAGTQPSAHQQYTQSFSTPTPTLPRNEDPTGCPDLKYTPPRYR